jgi:DNA-binding response OmpR family regulator
MKIMRILVISNIDALRSSLANTLRDAGFEAEEVDTAEAGINIALLKPVDVAIVGPCLPPAGDEVTLIQTIRQYDLWFPIMAVSSCERWAHISNLLTAGADEYLAEPFPTATLLFRLEKLLQDNPHRQALEFKLNTDFGTIRLHNLGQLVYINDKPTAISSYDYLSLKCIAQNLGENGLTPHALADLASHPCDRNMFESAEYLLQRIRP